MKNNYIFLLFSLLLSFTTVWGQPINLDSLERKLRLTFDNKAQRLELCLLLGKNYQHINYQKAYTYSYEALQIAEQQKNEPQIQWAKVRIGEALAFAGKNVEALPYFNQVLASKLAQQDKKLMIKVLSGLARANMMLKFNDQALKYYMEILNHVTDDKEKIDIGIHQWLANAYKKQGNYEKALTYLTKDLLEDKYQNNPSLLSEIGNLYYTQKKYAEALPYYQDAYLIAQQKKDIQACSFSTNNIGLVYAQQEDYPKAIEYYNLSLQYSKNVGNNRDYTNTLSNLAQLYTKQKAYKNALEYVKQGFGIAQTLKDYPLLIELANDYIQLYEGLQDDKQVIAYQRLMISYQDSIALQQREQDVLAIQLQAKIAEDRQTMQNLSHQNQLLWVYSWVGGLSILVLLAFILLIYNQNRLRKKVIAQQKNTLMLLAEKETAEKALHTIEQQQVQTHIDRQNRVLASQALLLTKKNEILETTEQHLAGFVKTLLPEQQENIKNLLKELRNTVQKDNDWNSYKLHFEEVHPNFFKTLQQLHPTLTINDLRVCAYLKMQLSNKEIAVLMSISPDSLKVNLSRLKIKLQLNKEQELRLYIENL